MSTLTRRGFFGRLVAVSVGAAAAMQAKPIVPPLMLNMNAFKGLFKPSVRYIQHYDVTTDQMIKRLDVRYGYGCIAPNTACRIDNA